MRKIVPPVEAGGTEVFQKQIDLVYARVRAFMLGTNHNSCRCGGKKERQKERYHNGNY